MTSPRTRCAQRGMTATELVVACMILLIFTGLIFATFRTDTHHFSRLTAQTATQSPLRIWAARMQQDIRRACFNPTGTNPNPFAIVAATPTDFEFNLDEGPTTGTLSSSDAHSNIGYRLNGTNLELWQSGSTWRVVLTNVTGLSFAYYDSQGSQRNQTSPYTSTQGISAVEVTLTAQASTGGYNGAAAPAVTEHFEAALRNQC